MSPRSEHGLPPGLTLARALATQEAGRAAALAGQDPSRCSPIDREVAR